MYPLELQKWKHWRQVLTKMLSNCWWDCKSSQLLGKPLGISTRLNNCAHFDAANLLPGVNATETCVYVHWKTSSMMYIAALFIIAPQRQTWIELINCVYSYSRSLFSNESERRGQWTTITQSQEVLNKIATLKSLHVWIHVEWKNNRQN